MWAVAAQPRTGLTPMIPTPSVDCADVTQTSCCAWLTASRGKRHHGLDVSCFRRVLCCNIDLIQGVRTNEPVEGQTASPAQFDEPWNELPGVAVPLVGAGQANAPAEQVRHVDGDLR